MKGSYKRSAKKDREKKPHNALLTNTTNDFQHNAFYLAQYKSGEHPEALEWLLCNNRNLVRKIVGKYVNLNHHRLDYDDLFSAGMAGLLKAIDRFDLSYENNFSTYATYWVKQTVTRAIMEEGHTIRIPVYMFETINRISRYEQLQRSEEKPIEEQVLCTDLDISTERYERIKEIKEQLLNPASLSKLVSREDDKTELQDLVSEAEANRTSGQLPLGDPERQLLIDDSMTYLYQAMGALTDREQRVILHRFGLNDELPKTLEEISRMENVTRERIRQIELRALRKLRTELIPYANVYRD